eukprot:9015858-Pyramimonas_sp.AAC.1
MARQHPPAPLASQGVVAALVQSPGAAGPVGAAQAAGGPCRRELALAELRARELQPPPGAGLPVGVFQRAEFVLWVGQVGAAAAAGRPPQLGLSGK